MKTPELSILIPAAGSSQRLGQSKQLVQHKGKTLIQNAVDTAYSLTPKEIIVVTGANANAVKHAVIHPSVRYIHNPDWCTGMGGSLALGAITIDVQSSGVLILLCDQWRIQPIDLKILVKSWRADTARIVCADSGGINMPPVIFPASCFDLLKKLENDQGARCLLKAQPELVRPVTLKNAAFDLNTPAQLEELIQLDKPGY